ncbi:MAG: hypothetical protein AAGC43_04580 [Bacteroidota bacterium]
MGVELAEAWWDDLIHPITGYKMPAEDRVGKGKRTPREYYEKYPHRQTLPFTHPDYKESITHLNIMHKRAEVAANLIESNHE